MAAAFRLVHFPPATTTAAFLHSHHQLPTPPPRLLSLTTAKPQTSNNRLVVVQSQSEPTVVVSETAQEIKAEVVKEEEEVSDTRLLLQNLPWTCTADDLRPLLQNYGTVVDIEFSMYNKSRNRGLAFVTMSSHEEALAAITSLESSEFEGRVLRVNWAKPKKEKPSTPPPQPKPLPVHNLFVANLPFQARAKDIKEFFNADNANAVSAEVIFQGSLRRSMGYGFVSFNTKSEADAALRAFDGKEFMGRTIRVARSKRFLRQETKATIESEQVDQISEEAIAN